VICVRCASLCFAFILQEIGIRQDGSNENGGKVTRQRSHLPDGEPGLVPIVKWRDAWEMGNPGPDGTSRQTTWTDGIVNLRHRAHLCFSIRLAMLRDRVPRFTKIGGPNPEDFLKRRALRRSVIGQDLAASQARTDEDAAIHDGRRRLMLPISNGNLSSLALTDATGQRTCDR
jgi:hypothetical protein